MPLQQSPDVVHTCPYSAQGVPPSGAASTGGGGVASSGGGGVASGSGGGASGSGGGASGGGVEPSGVPPSGGGVPQIPRVEPGGIVHGKPGQQSAVVVQLPPLPTQRPPHTKGATPVVPASGLKLGLGTQADPPQSALVEQAWPCSTPASLQGIPFMVQRGIPRMSC